jgi:hypothetical protein
MQAVKQWEVQRKNATGHTIISKHTSYLLKWRGKDGGDRFHEINLEI